MTATTTATRNDHKLSHDDFARRLALLAGELTRLANELKTTTAALLALIEATP